MKAKRHMIPPSQSPTSAMRPDSEPIITLSNAALTVPKPRRTVKTIGQPVRPNWRLEFLGWVNAENLTAT